MIRKNITNHRASSLIALFLFAAIGAHLVFLATAAKEQPPAQQPPLGYISNPPFAYTCGFNVVIHIDSSSSRDNEQLDLDKRHISSFMDAMRGSDTHFLLSMSGDSSPLVPYTTDTARITEAMDTIRLGGPTDMRLEGWSEYNNYRPSKQTIAMVFTDGGDPIYAASYEPASRLKASGVRIIAFILPLGKYNLVDPQKITGPNIDTGSILTSDIVHNSSYATLTSQLNRFATIDSCNPPPGPSQSGPGSGSGSGTSGPGSGSGSGTGNGRGGGGGSTAKTQSTNPNTIPASTDQGDTTKQPELNPSPFFDGRQYEPGSNPDTFGATAFSVGGRRVVYGWLYLFVALFTVAAGSFYFWRRNGKK